MSDDEKKANPYKAEIDIKLGGHNHILRLDLDQVMEIEQRLGSPMSHLLYAGGKGVAIGFLREVIFESIETIGKVAKKRRQIARMMTITMQDPDLGFEYLVKRVTVLVGMGAFGKTRDEMEEELSKDPDRDEDDFSPTGEGTEDQSPLSGSTGLTPVVGSDGAGSSTGPSFSPSVSKLA